MILLLQIAITQVTWVKPLYSLLTDVSVS